MGGGAMKKMAMVRSTMSRNAPAPVFDDAPLPTGEADIFTPSKGTIEYNEKKYFFGPVNSKVEEFWSDAAAHLVQHGSNKGFLSGNFLFGFETMTEALGVLALLDLSFEPAALETTTEGQALHLRGSQNVLLLTNEIVERPGESVETDVLCAQRFFDKNDRFVYDDQDNNARVERPIDEFVAGRVYGCRVVVTNCSASDLSVSLIHEVPQGSLPLGCQDTLRIDSVRVGSFQSHIAEFYFYFPTPGSFAVYPATVVRGDRIVATAKLPDSLVVEKTKRTKKLETISDILSMGNKADIVAFLRAKNVLNRNAINLSQIYGLLKDRAFWEQVLEVCRAKGLFDPTIWSYAFLHCDERAAAEYLAQKDVQARLPELLFCDSALLRVDAFEVREYYPLINPRAHVLGQEKTNIINDKFKLTYQNFLTYLFMKPAMSPSNKVVLVNYLIAQDRVEDALALANRTDVNASDAATRIQLDYQRAYLDFLTGFPTFAVVKATCERYLTYPVLSWRNLFVEMANQLAEFEEADVQSRLRSDKDATDDAKSKAVTAASFTAELKGSSVKVVSQNLSQLGIRFFKFDPEVLFSLSPFAFESGATFKFVEPFFRDTLTFASPKELSIATHEIPPALRQESFFVEVFSQSPELTRSAWLNYSPFGFGLQHSQEFGIVKIFDTATHRPVPRVYVKCFSMTRDGRVAFYKDGYTDLRGSFDYVSLNSDKLDNIAKFAVLISADQKGSKVLTAEPPARIGRTEGEVKPLISDRWRTQQQKQAQVPGNVYTKVI